MTQLSPTNLFTSQLVSKVIQFRADYGAGKFKTVDDVISNLKDIITQLNDNAHAPLTEYEPVAKGEPPLSEKMNRFWRSLQYDITNIEDQLIVLQASSLFLHNFYANELQKATNKNAQASNKLKTLQLYASAHDPNIITFGDHFRNQDFIDTTLTTPAQLVSLDVPGHVTLGRSGDISNLSKTASVKILGTSNGFLGNNQEINDPSKAPVAASNHVPLYTFAAQTNRHADLKTITDSDPTTWIEYESNKVSELDRATAKNLNFVYQVPAAAGTESDTPQLIDWAQGPPQGVLKLDLEFDLKGPHIINRIAYTPFGLQGDINYPVKVKAVQISSTGTNWTVITPQDVFIGTDVNLKAANTADNVTINTAEWLFPETEVRYIRISIEQSNPVSSNIGHLYYTNKTSQTTSVTETPDLAQIIGVKLETVENTTSFTRVQGPIPPITNPAVYYKNNNTSVQSNYLQNVEYFTGKRWAIGIRDCLIQEVKYQTSSVFVSKAFNINGIVDRVSIDANVDIPKAFSNAESWVKFYVSPDNGVNWYQISRIQDDFLGIPEIVAFNDPLPTQFQESGVAYHTTQSSVSSLRIKVEISRPTDQASSSPVLKSYTLKVRKR